MRTRGVGNQENCPKSCQDPQLLTTLPSNMLKFASNIDSKIVFLLTLTLLWELLEVLLPVQEENLFRFLISQDNRFLISQDSTCLISQDNTCHAGRERRKVVTWGMDGVALDRHGPILSQNEATDSRKVSGYLLDLRDALKNSKSCRDNRKTQNVGFPSGARPRSTPV